MLKVLPTLHQHKSFNLLWRRRQWQPTPVLLPGKSYGWRSLVGCSPWGHWGSDTTEWLHFHFSLSCSVLAWRIPGTGEPDGLPSMGSHRVGHDWSDLAAVAAAADLLSRNEEGRSEMICYNLPRFLNEGTKAMESGRALARPAQRPQSF